MAEGYKSPHLRLHGNPGLKSKPGGGKPGEEVGGGEHDGKQPPHMSETHGTQPHPKTGVHGMHVMHMGGGKHMTHTHHDGGKVSTEHHQDENSLHDHIKASFPTAQGDDGQHDQNADNDAFAGGGSMANMSAFGGGE